MAVAVFFLASTTRVGWVHLADAVLWGVILLSVAIPWLSMPGIRVERNVGSGERRDSPGPLEGDSLPVNLRLENRWWLPRFLVSVSYPIGVAGTERPDKNVFFWTWPRKINRHDTELTLERRGVHRLGECVVEITGPFGMFRRRRRIEMSHTVLAYPMWKPMQRLGLMESQAGEHEGRRKARTGTDASGTRTYVPGDPYRSIHWRNSARSGRLAVREFDTWNDRAVVLAIDTVNIVEAGQESSIDYAARVSASCAKVIERERGTVSVLTGSGESPEFMDWSGVMEYLARLDRHEDSTGQLAQKINGLQPGRRLMAFLTPESGAEVAAVAAAARRGIPSVAVMFSNSSDEAANVQELGSSVAPVLEQAGVRVVRCSPGGLDEAISEIESGTRKPVSVRDMSAVSPDERMAA